MLRYIFGTVSRAIVFIILASGWINGNIVYVHLGSQIPSYIYIALDQARLFNSDAHIYLIANQQALSNSQYPFAFSNIETIPCESLKQSSSHQLFLQKSPLDPNYREGFWRKASERFFYLHEFIASFNLQNVVHLESDNMLYVNISSLQQVLAAYSGIGAVFDSDNRCIPSFLYIADEQAIAELVAFIAENATSGYTDMEILALYRNKTSRQKIDNLPLIMPEYLKSYPLINALKQKAAQPERYCNKSEQFNSIFDGAAIGQYLGGIDPRNGPSMPGFINETCVFNPAHLSYEWRRDEKGRNVPFAVCHGAAYRINNLHIHSKHLGAFKS